MSGVTTTFVYDPMGQLAQEYGGPTIPGSESGPRYLTTDQLGSTRLVTDGGGNVAQAYDYLPFGQDFTLPTDSNRIRFTSKERDAETGLDWFATRYMSSAQGRFTSPDSYNIMEEMKKGKDEAEQRRILNDYLSNPQEWNKYTYALNNPLKLVDPDGRNACGTNDDSTCKVTVTLQDRTKDKNGNYNDQFTGEKNQQQYNATATVFSEWQGSRHISGEDHSFR